MRMSEKIETLALENFSLLPLPQDILEEREAVVRELLTKPFEEADKLFQAYCNKVRLELARRLHDSQHQLARIGLQLHIAAIMCQVGMRKFCEAALESAVARATKQSLIEGSAAISVLRAQYRAIPYEAAEVAQLCKGTIPAESLLEIAAMELREDPLGAAYGVLIEHGIDDPQHFFIDKGFLSAK